MDKAVKNNLKRYLNYFKIYLKPNISVSYIYNENSSGTDGQGTKDRSKEEMKVETKDMGLFRDLNQH